MLELLTTVILTVCPMPNTVETTECHEFLVNCAVKGSGTTDEQTIKYCVDRWREKSE